MVVAPHGRERFDRSLAKLLRARSAVLPLTSRDALRLEKMYVSPLACMRSGRSARRSYSILQEALGSGYYAGGGLGLSMENNRKSKGLPLFLKRRGKCRNRCGNFRRTLKKLP